MIRLFIIFLSTVSILTQSVNANTYGFWQNIEANINSFADINTNATYNLYSNQNNTLFAQTGIKFDTEDFITSQGFGYRYFDSSKIFMFGANTVYDWKVLKGGSYHRLSLGFEFRFPYVSLNTNYYLPLSKEKKINKNEKNYLTGVYSGYDLELIGNVPLWKGKYLNRLDLSAGFYSWMTNTKAKLGTNTLKGYESFKKQTSFSLGTNLYVAYGIELFVKHYFKNFKDSSSISINDNETEFGLKYVYNFDSKSRAVMNTNPANLEQYRFKKVNRDYNVKLYAGEAAAEVIDKPIITTGNPTLTIDADEYPDIPSLLLFSDENTKISFNLGSNKLDAISSCDLYADDSFFMSLTITDTNNCSTIFPPPITRKMSTKLLKSKNIDGVFAFKINAVATGEVNGEPLTITSKHLDLVIINMSSVTVNTNDFYINGVEGTINAEVPDLSSLGYNYTGCDVVRDNQLFKAKLSDGTNASGNAVKICNYSFIPDATMDLGFKFYSNIGDITTSDSFLTNIDVIKENTFVVPLVEVFASSKQNIFAVMDMPAKSSAETKANKCELTVDGKVKGVSFYRKLNKGYCFENDFAMVDHITDPSKEGIYSIGMSYNGVAIGKNVNMKFIPDPGKPDIDGNFEIAGDLKTSNPERVTVGFSSRFTFKPKVIGVDYDICRVTIDSNPEINANLSSNGDCLFSYIPKKSGDINVKITLNSNVNNVIFIYKTTVLVNPEPILGKVVFEKPVIKLGETQNVKVEITNPQLFTNIICRLIDTTGKIKDLPVIPAGTAGVDDTIGTRVCKFTDFNPQTFGFGVGVASIAADILFLDANSQIITTVPSTLEITSP